MIDFPIDPIEDDNFLDTNGRMWLYKNGYWQEVIMSFSIDLLRDVKTEFDTQSIKFVDAVGFQTSVDATVDFPFIDANNDVSNIPYTAYGLPFYTSLGAYDEIDITKYSPPTDSLLYWDGENFVPDLKFYTTEDVVGFNSTNAKAGDVMVWQTDKFVPVEKDAYVDYKNSYQKQYLAEIDSTAYTATAVYDSWIKQGFNQTMIANDPNMVDLANNRLVCTSAGMYRVCFMAQMDHIASHPTRYHFGAQYQYRVLNKYNHIMHRWYNNEERIGNSYYYEQPQYGNFTIIAEVPLYVGDYIDFYFKRVLIYYSWAFTSYHKGTMSMFKIHDDIPPEFVPVFIGTYVVDSKLNTSGNKVIVNLDAGTYEMRPVEYLGWKASSPFNYVSGCDVSGNNCATGWKWQTKLNSPEIAETAKVGLNGYQETEQQAFDEALAMAVPNFTITYNQDVEFWSHDSIYDDNRGATNFELWKVIE